MFWFIVLNLLYSIDSNYEYAYKFKQGSGNVNEFESFLKGDYRYEHSFEIGDIDTLFEQDFTFKEAKYFIKVSDILIILFSFCILII